MLCRPRLGWSCHVEREADARTALRAVMRGRQDERTRELTARVEESYSTGIGRSDELAFCAGGDGRCFICIGGELVLLA